MKSIIIKRIEIFSISTMLLLMLAGCGSKTIAIDGTWYSSRSDAEQITFERGEFSSPSMSWLPGKVTVDGNKIVVVDKLGDTTTFYLYDNDTITMEEYSDDNFDWAFFRSESAAKKYAEDQATAKEAQAAQVEEDKQNLLEAKSDDVISFLTQGTWDANDGLNSLSFTQDGTMTNYPHSSFASVSPVVSSYKLDSIEENQSLYADSTQSNQVFGMKVTLDMDGVYQDYLLDFDNNVLYSIGIDASTVSTMFTQSKK